MSSKLRVMLSVVVINAEDKKKTATPLTVYTKDYFRAGETVEVVMEKVDPNLEAFCIEVFRDSLKLAMKIKEDSEKIPKKEEEPK